MHKHKTVLITGCSSGFGLLIAARLSSSGYSVYATMRNLSKKDALLNEVQKRGAEVHLKELDVTKPDMIKSVIQEISQKTGKIDILINNAGYGIGGFFEDLTQDEIRSQMETNFFGVQNMIREVLHVMRPHRSGKIINVSSVAGFSSSPCFGAYNASKWALEGFCESLYYECKMFDIDIVMINPGPYKTNIFHENARYAKNFDNEDSPYYETSQKLKHFVIEQVNGLNKDPEDIAILAERILNTNNPRFHYYPDVHSKLLRLFKRILPFSLYSKIIQGKFISKD